MNLSKLASWSSRREMSNMIAWLGPSEGPHSLVALRVACIGNHSESEYVD